VFSSPTRIQVPLRATSYRGHVRATLAASLGASGARPKSQNDGRGKARCDELPPAHSATPFGMRRRSRFATRTLTDSSIILITHLVHTHLSTTLRLLRPVSLR
jgi:hypothetical protein